MTGGVFPFSRLHFALFLVSAALIAFQLEQMQLLALIQWHHFAYLVISVALLGFGMSGTLVALYKDFLLRNLGSVLPLILFGCAVLMSLALPISQGIVSRFDVSLLFIDPGQAGLLLAGQIIYLLVFLCGAMSIGLVFIHYSSQIGSLYCANLIGSGVGGALAVVGMFFVFPAEFPGLTALLPWSAGMLIVPNWRSSSGMAGIVSLIVIGMVIASPPKINQSPYKALSMVLELPDSVIVEMEPSPYGLVHVVDAPYLRYAPGLSLTYSGEVKPVDAAFFINGDWFGALGAGYGELFEKTVMELPYKIDERQRVLVLEPGAGMDVFHAHARGAKSITAVDPHRSAVSIIIKYAEMSGIEFFKDPAIKFSFLSPRAWLASDTKRYDLIVLPDVGSFGGSSGFFALHEQYLLTKEGVLDLWDHLGPNGMLRVSAWIDSPLRNSLRLESTIVETLEAEGVEPGKHMAAIRGWEMVTFVVKRSPLSAQDIGRIRLFCERLQFDPLLLPGLQAEEREHNHRSNDRDFVRAFDRILFQGGRESMYADYLFDLKPVVDDRPFFSQFLRLERLPELFVLIGKRSTPFLELGYVLVLISFVQMAAMAVLLILLPLLRLRVPGQKVIKRWVIPYFSCLGLGYMFFEIILMHELVLYLGHPVFAASAVISALLIFSGLGSLYSQKSVSAEGRDHALAAGIVALILLGYFFGLPTLLHASMGLSITWKIVFFLLLVAPPSFFMGMPFPLGLGRLAGQSKTQAAWAWGINGCVSVVSTGLAAILAVEFGFAAVLGIACCAYAVAAAVGYKT